MSTVPEVFVRWEGFVRWLLPRTMRFPSSIRHSLTDRIEHHALLVFEALVDRAFEHVCQELDEAGRSVGGWARHAEARA